MSTQDHAAPPRGRCYRGLWLLACVPLAWLQMTLAGYELGVGNQSIQVPFLLRLHNGALFARDVMVNTTLATYPSLFYRLLAHALAIVPLPTLYFVLHLLTTAGVFFAVLELGRATFKSYWPGIVAVGLLLAGHHHALAEQTLYSTGFTHTWAIFPLTLAALALLYANHPFAAFALAGVGFNIHALEAGQLGLAMSVWAICSLPPRKVAGLLAVFLILASPTVIQMLAHPQHFDADWLQLMQIRSGHHSFPFTWWRAGQPDLPRFLLILALAGVAMSLVPGEHVRKTLLLTGGVALLFVAGILFSEVWPNAFVIRAQLFRSSRFLMVIAFVYIAAGCVQARGLERIGAVLIVACLAAPPWLGLLPVTVLVITLVALFRGRLLWQQAVLAGVALLVTVVAWRTIEFVPVSFSWNFHRPEPGNDPAWLDAQRWACDHTLVDAVFLTPAQMNGFRVHSERAVVGEWRDGTQLYFSAAFAQPWWERMNALQPGMRVAPDGNRLLVQGRSLSQLDDAQIMALAQQFDADYAVVATDPPRKLVAVYRNARWAIYRPEPAKELPVVKTDTQRFLDEVAWPNIEQHRRSDVRLQIVDAAGRPLYDARYRVTQTNSPFLFGGHNYTVLTNAAWWCNIEPQDGQRRYAELDKAFVPNTRTEFSFCAGFPPFWLKVQPAAAQMKRLQQHTLDLIERYADRVDFWELTDQGLYMDQMSNLVAVIRAKHPGIKLGISDAPRLDRLDPARGLDDIRRLKGVGLDFVAIHGHQPWGVWADPKTLYELFDAFAKEGVRIHITQFVTPSEGWIEGPVRQGQWTPELAAEYRRLFCTVAFSHPAVDAINPADMYWSTKATGTLPLDGVIAFRGFYGDYEIEVTPPSGPTVRGTFSVRPGRNNYRLVGDAAGKLVVAK